jgi:hypothetical protein
MSEEGKLRPSQADEDKVKGEHRKVFGVEAGGYKVLCRGPKRAEWRRFLDVATADGGKRYGASVTLFSQCLVWPSSKELDAVYDDEPVLESSLVSNFVAALQEGYDGEAKKLLAASTLPGETCSTPGSVFSPIDAATTAKTPSWGRCSRPIITPWCIAT